MNEHDRLNTRITELEADLAAMGEEVRKGRAALDTARGRSGGAVYMVIRAEFLAWKQARRATDARPGCVAAIEKAGA